MLQAQNDAIRNVFAQGVCALTLTLLSPVGVSAADNMEFLPPGGKAVLVEHLGADETGNIKKIAGMSATEEEWRELLSELLPDVGEKVLATAVGYSEANFPLSTEVLAESKDTDIVDVLPPDGKELAINNCQSCHSLFSGYLTHDRDVTGWLGVFKSPFHSEIPMSEAERNTFARYSAINMPLSIEDVPPAYRF